MMEVALVAIFGGVGCALRVLVRDAMQRRGHHPWVALGAINLLGSLVIGGVMAGARLADGAVPAHAVTAAIGTLAGWTTYSAFAMDVVQLWWRGERGNAIALWAVTLAGSPALAWLAAMAVHAAFGGVA